MIKKLLLITILIVLYFRNIVAMNEVPAAFLSNLSDHLTQPIDRWNKLSPLTNEEMRIYKKTWNYKSTLTMNKSNLADIFCDVCCDFSFSILSDGNGVVRGRSLSNPHIIFIRNTAAVNSFIKKDLKKYAITNFLDNVGHPRQFTFEMKEQIRKQIRTIAEDSVGCKLLRIATSKIAVGNFPKLIFIPLEQDSKTAIDDGMEIHSGIYGWQIESDRFMSKIKIANTMKEKVSELKNQLFDFQKYSQMKLPKYNYVLFSSEKFFDRPLVTAIRSIGTKFEFFDVKLPMDATLYRIIVRSLYSRKSSGQENIKARLNLKKKKFSQKLNYKFNNMLTLLTEADCFLKLSPQVFREVKKLGGIKNYASYFVQSMSESIRLDNIEKFISSYYVNDMEYRAQYGLTAYGFDSLNESSYLSHRYHWIRVSNSICMKNSKNFENVYEYFIQEQGDFDLYSYFLSPNSSIKYPIFGIGQYQCVDSLNIVEERSKNHTEQEKKHVKFLHQQYNEKNECFFRA